MDELIQEFLVESNENLDRFDGDLVKLEGEPGSKELLSSIFRSIHSIKGACGFLGFQKLEKLAHAGESLLSKLRDGQLALTAEIGSALLEAGDRIRQMLAAIGETGADGEEQYQELIERLKRLQEEEPPQAVVVQAVVEPTGVVSAEEGRLAAVPEESPIREAASHQEVAARPHEMEEVVEARTVGEVAEPATVADDGPRTQEETRTKSGAQDSTIRVNVTVLDRLMTLVGELVLARNQLLQFSNTLADAGFHTISQHMNLIATELQEEVMKTRMQPIGNIWSKFPRTVRDLVVSCGKEVRIEMEGKETELDKTIIEAIKDPLTHLVRNSVDHGIELPEVRVKAGKDPVGVLTLRAFHEGGQVNIEIADDGAGLNVERIRAKAVERGVVSAEQAERMQESEIFNLIFLPGFSTAAKVTNVSGRGVGMDVVKTNIERIGGTVDVQSKAGKGTSIRVKIPLTLAIIPALVVTCDGDRFAIPQVALTELVSLEAGDTRGGIETVHGAPVYRLRGKLLPVLYLRRELGLAARKEEESGAVNIVVLRVDSRQFGLVVDEINDTEEIVVKPLRKELKNVKTFAGASIMGDGMVALILDVPGLAQRANLGAQASEDRQTNEKTAEGTGEARQTLLLFESQGKNRMAIPLSAVARLEEFDRDQVDVLSFTDPTGTYRSYGDNWFGLKYRYLGQTKHRPSLGLQYEAKMPTGNVLLGMSSGEVDHALALIASKDIRRLHFDFNVIPQLIGLPAGAGFDHNMGFAWATWLPVTKRLTLVTEPYGYTALNAQTEGYASWMAGCSVQVRPRTYLDAGMDFGVTATAPHSRVYGGVTFAVANVYRWVIPQR